MAEQPEQKAAPRLDVVAINDSPAARAHLPPAIRFNRLELQTILDTYGRKVANGDWRDYALDFLRDRALFSVYRHHSERPLYVIEKNPRLRERQGQYLVLAHDGRVLKRGHDLATVLRVLEPKLMLVRR